MRSRPVNPEVGRLLLRTKRGLFGIAVLALFTLLAIFGSALAPEDPHASGLDVLAPPSAAHPLGTTEAGSDVLSQLMVGARVSIVVGFAAALISAVLGAAVGVVGGHFCGVAPRNLPAVREWVPGIP